MTKTISFSSSKFKLHNGGMSASELIKKKREKHIKPVMCKQCDQFFLPKRSTAVFCSSKCRLQCHRASKSPAAS